jgi:hypothetical protein
MVEEFELDQGPVYDTCKCSTNQTTDLNLPNHCYSPDGTNCGWYEECLEKKISMKGDALLNLRKSTSAVKRTLITELHMLSIFARSTTKTIITLQIKASNG